MPRQAGVAVATTDQRIRHHPPAILQPSYEFVSKNQGRLAKRAVAKKPRKIRAAHASHFDRHLRLAAGDRWSAPFLNFNPLRTHVNQRFHVDQYIRRPDFRVGRISAVGNTGACISHAKMGSLRPGAFHQSIQPIRNV